MAGYDIGLKLGIDGEAEFRAALKQAADTTKTLGTEMGAVTAEFARSANSEEALRAKTATLTKQIEAQRTTLAMQQEYLARSTELYGDADARTQSWQRTVNKSTEQLHRMENALADMGDSLDESSEKTFSFGDALKANIIGDLVVDGLERVAGLIRDLGPALVEAAADVQAENAQFEQTFGDLGSEAEAALKRVADSSGMLESRLKGAGTQVYAFARSAGGDAATSMDIMERAMTVAADSAAYYDRSMEDTLDSLQSFLKGNYANDAALGLSATETTRNAAAMELFGQKFKDLTEIQKQEALLKMVEDSMALSGAMGQAQREAAGWANVQGNLNEALRLMKADIGEGILPAVTELSQALTGALTGEIDAATFGEAAASIVAELVCSFAAQAPKMVASGIETVSAFLDGLMADDNPQEIADSAAEIIAALVSGMVDLLPKIAEFGLTLLTALAEALGKNLPTLLGKVPDIILGIVGALLEGLPDFFNAGAQLIAGLYNGIESMKEKVISKVKELASSVVDAFKNLLGIHSPSRVFMGLGEYMMEGLADGMERSERGVLSTAKQMAAAVTDQFQTVMDPAWSGSSFGGLTPAFSGANFVHSYSDVARTMQRGGGASSVRGAAARDDRTASSGPALSVFRAQITMKTEDGRNMGSWMTQFVNEENAANPPVRSDDL